MSLAAIIATLIGSLALPLVTALVTKAIAATLVKQSVAALLAIAIGIIVTAYYLDGIGVISRQSVLLSLAAWAFAQAYYVGLYRPHGINARIAPRFGIGPVVAND